jgi:hypothetical protein
MRRNKTFVYMRDDTTKRFVYMPDAPRVPLSGAVALLPPIKTFFSLPPMSASQSKTFLRPDKTSLQCGNERKYEQLCLRHVAQPLVLKASSASVAQPLLRIDPNVANPHLTNA